MLTQNTMMPDLSGRISNLESKTFFGGIDMTSPRTIVNRGWRDQIFNIDFNGYAIIKMYCGAATHETSIDGVPLYSMPNEPDWYTGVHILPLSKGQVLSVSGDYSMILYPAKN